MEEDLGGGISLKMLIVEGGAFEMGPPEENEVGGWPSHHVTLDGFHIGKYEVTQAQWEVIMGTTVAEQRDVLDPTFPLNGIGDDYPMYYVCWYEAVQFCEKLTQATGKKYRLPTEAEWEYAARGGQYADGTLYAGSDYLLNVGWVKSNSDQAHPVGQKGSNSLGLYDMSGNVGEWCCDWYESDYYSGSPFVNPQGPTSGSYRVNRGGGWAGDVLNCRVSARVHYAPDVAGNILGFRVACSAE